MFAEDQIFRIDHFLGKEPAQNILAFRFANGLFEPIWNRNFIDHVQIDVPETLGLGNRAGFYEQTGAYPRHGGDAPLPDPRLHGDGAADRPRAGADQRGEEQGLPLHAADRSRTTSCAGSTAATAAEEGVDRRIGHRDLHRAEAARSTTGAGPACRSSCAPASAWPRDSASSRSPSANRPRACSRPDPGVGAQGPDHLTFDLADASKMSLSFYGKRPGPGMRLDKLSLQFAMHDTGHGSATCSRPTSG